MSNELNPKEPNSPETPAAAVVEEVKPAPTWADLKLSSEAIAILEGAGFLSPTSIQSEAIPHAMAGKDLIASAQTGTGKTAAFVLPVVEKLAGRSGTFALILAPTREIAQQIDGTLKILGAPRGVTSAVLIGGIELAIDKEALSKYPNVLVATPGRLCDHLERGNVWLEFIETLVLDEADKMLDMGFTDQLKRITQEIPETRQTLLFSATISAMVERLAQNTLRDPVQITIGRRQSATANVEQRLLWMREENKNAQLRQLLRQEKGSVIVFVRSKEGADRLWRSLHSNDFYDVTCIHSDRRQQDREKALQEFKEGKFRILIATDVVGRGIHVDGIAHVVNFDLPLEADDYIHRIGRTGRRDASGRATTFMTFSDRKELQFIEKLLKNPIPDEQADDTKPTRFTGAPGSGGGGGRFSGSRSGGGRPGGSGGGSRGRSGGGGGGSGSGSGGRPRHGNRNSQGGGRGPKSS